MKQTITFNNKLTLSFPDTFHVMSGEDREALTFLAEGPGDCLSDPDRHMIISRLEGARVVLLFAVEYKGCRKKHGKPAQGADEILQLPRNRFGREKRGP